MCIDLLTVYMCISCQCLCNVLKVFTDFYNVNALANTRTLFSIYIRGNKVCLLSLSLSLSYLSPSPLPPPSSHTHQSFEFEVYLRYAQNYMEALAHFDNLMEDEEVVKHFESQPTKLFKEAMQYLLPKSLLEPIYHCFYYFEVLDVSCVVIDLMSTHDQFF